MSYPVKIHLQLINMPQEVVKPRNLSISHRNRIARPIVLLLRYHLRLLGKMVQSRLYLFHQAIEMPAESGEGGAVEEQESLGGCARRRT
jgi:hypothetical protein